MVEGLSPEVSLTDLSDGTTRTSCLINNYNYAQYILEAVDSALTQTRPFDEIIIVDDGSTDGSREVLQAHYGNNPGVRLVFKPNGGQLSAFRAGFEVCRGDLVFFLDADDRFAPTKVEEIVDAFARHPDCGMICTPTILFGNQCGIDFLRNPAPPYEHKLVTCDEPLAQFQRSLISELDLGRAFSSVDGTGWGWVGSPTSSMVIRRTVLANFLPLMAPFEPFWRTRADDCLVMGVAATNASRRYLHRPLTEYRIHGRNNFFGHGDHDDAKYLEKTLNLRGWLNQQFRLERCWVLNRMIDEWLNPKMERFKRVRRALRVPQKMKYKFSERWVLRLIFFGWLLGLKSCVRLDEIQCLKR